MFCPGKIWVSFFLRKYGHLTVESSVPTFCCGVKHIPSLSDHSPGPPPESARSRQTTYDLWTWKVTVTSDDSLGRKKACSFISFISAKSQYECHCHSLRLCNYQNIPKETPCSPVSWLTEANTMTETHCAQVEGTKEVSPAGLRHSARRRKERVTVETCLIGG